MSKFRGFIAVEIDLQPKIVDFANQIKKTGADVKLVEPENMHLTLKFLGDTDEKLVDEIEQIMKESVEGVDSFNIQLKGSGVFPNQNYIKVIWIGMQNGEQITNMAQKIDEKISKLGFTKEKRGFSPHLTIGRVRNAKNKDQLLEVIEKHKDTLFAEIKVDSLQLKKSDLTPKGPIYTTLKKVKIGE